MMMVAAVSVTTSVQAKNNYREVDMAIDLQDDYGEEPHGKGTGEDTLDLANILTGVINVEAVFEVFHVNEDVRDLDTRTCGEIGVKELSKGGGSTGKHCCEEFWETEGEDLMNGPLISRKMRGNLGGWDEYNLNTLFVRKQFIDYCCRLSDDKARGDKKVFCKTVADEKTGCVKGKLKGGSDLEGAMSACDMYCDAKLYGEMKHSENGEYDDKEIDNLMRKCTMEDVDWAPSETVPSAEEFAPVIPTSIIDL